MKIGEKNNGCLFIYLFIYLCGLFYDTARFLECIASSGLLISESWIEQNVKLSGRGLILDSILEFAWRDRGKPRKPHSWPSV
jgi:hypothetical protein